MIVFLDLGRHTSVVGSLDPLGSVTRHELMQARLRGDNALARALEKKLPLGASRRGLCSS